MRDFEQLAETGSQAQKARGSEEGSVLCVMEGTSGSKPRRAKYVFFFLCFLLGRSRWTSEAGAGKAAPASSAIEERAPSRVRSKRQEGRNGVGY
jgi:hypothetical protein